MYLHQIWQKRRGTQSKTFTNTDFLIFTLNSKKSNLVKKWGGICSHKTGKVSPQKYLHFVGVSSHNKVRVQK